MMRSVRLLAVAVLGVILAAFLFVPVAAQYGEIRVAKVTTNGDTTTWFRFELSWYPDGASLRSSDDVAWFGLLPGVYTVKELVPAGWAVRVGCVGAESTFTYIPGGVTITYVEGDYVTCTFTNSPARPVGGVVMPANTFVLVAPWLAVIGLVGCIGTVVVAKKRR